MLTELLVISTCRDMTRVKVRAVARARTRVKVRGVMSQPQSLG